MKFRSMLRAILISFIIAVILIFLVSDDAFYSMRLFLICPFTKLRYFADIIENMIPLIFTGLGMCFIFTSGEFNLAIEGGFHIGGFTAACMAILCSNALFHNVAITLLLAGIAGAIVLFIPAMIKLKCKASELVTSLMLNFIILNLTNFLLMKYIRDPMTGSGSYEISKDMTLSTVFSGTHIHTGLIIAVFAVIISYLILYKTPFGLKLRISGKNKKYAEISGLDVFKIVIIGQLIGGFLAGLGGGVEILSPIYSRYTWTSLLGFGWDAVVIAILAKNNPIKVPLYAFFLAYIRTGAYIMERMSDVSSEIVLIFQAVITLAFISEVITNKKREEML